MTTADTVFENVEQFTKHIQRLRKKRRMSIVKTRINRKLRKSPNFANRQRILRKTDGRCHICGGLITSEDKWQADHVFAYAHGGKDSIDNYLPAHTICNNYRWNYDAEEFQWILKLGVWLRTQIEKERRLGREAADRFLKYEIRRDSRRNK